MLHTDAGCDRHRWRIWKTGHPPGDVVLLQACGLYQPHRIDDAALHHLGTQVAEVVWPRRGSAADPFDLWLIRLRGGAGGRRLRRCADCKAQVAWALN